MASESRGGLSGDLGVRGAAAARRRARRVRVRPGLSRAGLWAVPLFVDGVLRGRVYVAVGSMVDIAVRELGARLTEVEPVSEEPTLIPPPE